MKMKIFALFVCMMCLVTSNQAQSATLSGFNGTITLSSFANNGPYVRGTLKDFRDQTGLYICSNIDTADVVWDNNGKRYSVVSVISSNSTQAVVDLNRLGGGTHIPKGAGFVCRETANGLSLVPAQNANGISSQLMARVLTHNMQVLKNANSPEPIYILAMGQSNMTGYAFGGDTTINQNVKIWDINRNYWKIAKVGEAPIHLDYLAYKNNNLAFHFAKKIQEETGREVRLMLLATAGIPIENWLKVSNRPEWTRLISETTAAGNPKFNTILWHQGEYNGDGFAPDCNNDNCYRDSLYKLIKVLRAQPFCDSTTKFIAGNLAQPLTWGAATGRENVLLDLNNDELDYTGCADTKGLPTSDGTHFTGESLVKLGRERYYEVYTRLPELTVRTFPRILLNGPIRTGYGGANIQFGILDGDPSYGILLGRKDGIGGNTLGIYSYDKFVIGFTSGPYDIPKFLFTNNGTLIVSTEDGSTIYPPGQIKLSVNGAAAVGWANSFPTVPVQGLRVRKQIIGDSLLMLPDYATNQMSASALGKTKSIYTLRVATDGTFTNEATQRAIASGNTDGSGDLTVNFATAMPDVSYTMIVQAEGDTYFTTAVRTSTKAVGSVKVRFFDAAGAALTLTAVSISYKAEDN